MMMRLNSGVLMVAVLGLLFAGGHKAAAMMDGMEFLDMCEAYGRSHGIRAAAASCRTLRSVCLPSKASGRSAFFENPYIDSMMLDVLRDSCETLYMTNCRNSAMRVGKKMPGCSEILLGTAFTTDYCPDVETAVEIFDEGLTDCDDVPAEMFLAAGIPPPQGSVTPTLPKVSDIQKNRDAFMKSTLGRTLKNASSKLPAKSGEPNDPCDCTDDLSGGQNVDIQGCADNVCYTVGGKACGTGFPSAKYPGAYMRLCT